MDQAFDPTQNDLSLSDQELDWTPTGWDEFAPPDHDESLDDAWTVVSGGQSVVLIDETSDGAWDHVAIDLDGDGHPDLVVSANGADYLVSMDTSGDGHFDHAEIATRADIALEAPEILEYFETTPIVVDVTDGSVSDSVTSTAVSQYWFEQAVNGYCVPASIAQIISAYTGMPFEDESAFIDLANQLGLWTVVDGVPGMTMDAALYLLEAAGVPATYMYSANMDMLEGFLESGHGVMLYVDSGMIWHGEEGVVDHALVILDIDRDAGLVVLSDPGHPEGNGLVVDLDVFEQAWGAGNNLMLVGEQPAEHGVSVGGQDVSGVTPTPDPVAPTQSLSEILPGGAALPELVVERLSQPTSTLEGVVSWVTRNPWVIVPVVLAAQQLRPNPNV